MDESSINWINGPHWCGLSLFDIMYFVIPIALASYLLSRLLTGGVADLADLVEWHTVMLGTGGAITFEAFAVSVAIMPALEEYVFRFALYKWLTRKIPLQSFYTAVGLFVVAHCFATPTLMLINVTILGIVCQHAYIATKNLAIPICVHGLFNLLVMLPKPSLATVLYTIGISPRGSGCLVLGAAVAAGIVLWLLIKRMYSASA